MRASTLNFFNPPDTKLRKLKAEGVISAREMNKNYTCNSGHTYKKSSNPINLRINFKPTLLSHRLHRSTPDMVWLNPKSRFKLIPELIASRAPKCIKSLGIGRSDRSKMTERFLEKQTTKLIAKINCPRQPSN